EGKAVLFKSFAGVDAFPICLDTTEVDEIVNTVKLLEPTFGGVNLEDIAAPNCFIVEEKLKKETRIPILHDDQHGTAIVTVGGLMHASELAGNSLKEIKVVANGAGAGGVAIVRIIESFGVAEIILCGSQGATYEGRPTRMNEAKESIAKK